MQKSKVYILILLFLGCASTASQPPVIVDPAVAEYETITENDLFIHLSFIASDELRGRNTPSPELDIAAKYLATRVESYGFKSLNPDGSFYQQVALDMINVDGKIVVNEGGENKEYNFPEHLIPSINSHGNFSGEMVFAGYGLSMPDMNWDDYAEIDVKDKIVIVLDGRLPSDNPLRSRENFRRVRSNRNDTPKMKGAKGIIHVINPTTENRYSSRNISFTDQERVQLGDPDVTNLESEISEFFSISIRHELALELLGITETNLEGLFEKISLGEQLESGLIENRSIDVEVKVDKKRDHTQNVVAILEGTDPILKDEYVLYGAHYDHVGTRNGEIWNGADDDGSGTVSLLEIAQAFSKNPQKRSIVMVWHCGEEKGLWGAKFFSEHPMIPLEKVSAQINLDMVGRNENNKIFVIGAGRISSELEKMNEEVNEKYIGLELDYKYDAPDDRNNFYARSDHYMYARFGIPIIFYFNDVHADYHRSTDTIEKIDFNKMQKVSRLAYLLGREIANNNDLLKLDADPKIKVRGKLVGRNN